MKLNLVLCTIVFLISNSTFARNENFGFFGTDDRQDITLDTAISGNPNSVKAKSVVTIVKRTATNLTEGGGFKFKPLSSVTKDLPICPEQKFSNQVRHTEVVCGGSLVGHDLVLTAKECISDVLDCTLTYSFIFDYTQGRSEFSPREVYHCMDVVFKKNINGTQVALIKLDRPVNFRTPLGLNLEAQLPEEAPLTLIGPHAKLSLKVSNGHIRYKSDDPIKNPGVATDLDCSKNDIGSPVFNSQGQVEGVVMAVAPLEVPSLPTKSLASEAVIAAPIATPTNLPETKLSTSSSSQPCMTWTSQPEILDRTAYVKEQKILSSKATKTSFIPKGCVYAPVAHFKEELIKYLPSLKNGTSSQSLAATTPTLSTASGPNDPIALTALPTKLSAFVETPVEPTPEPTAEPTEVAETPLQSQEAPTETQSQTFAEDVRPLSTLAEEIREPTAFAEDPTEPSTDIETVAKNLGVSPMTSRPRPPKVSPLEKDGIRFDQARDGLPLQAKDTSGWLRATDIASGQTLWLVQVYTAPLPEPGRPEVAGGPQTVYMHRLSFSEGYVIVEDELGREYQVDPKSGNSTMMP